MGANIYKNKRPLAFFLIPAFAFMTVFLYYPFVMNIVNSFQQIGGLAAESKGFLDPWYSNYAEMIQDKNMYTALKNTLILMVSTVVFQVGIALVLAILVDQIRCGAKFFRVVYFFPIVISATALGLLFNLIFLRDKGMLNQLLEIFGRTELILLHNVMCTCVVLAVTGALKTYDLPWVMFPKGMPLNSTWLTSTYMYYHACETRNTDYGCAIGGIVYAGKL